MIRTTTDKLVAKILGILDVGTLYPGSTLEGQVALDVVVEQGILVVGSQARLSCGSVDEVVEITGVEMPSHTGNPNVIRVFCSKPATLALPNGKAEGWVLLED